MADAVIELATNPDIGSITIDLYPAGSDPIANDIAAATGIVLTQATNQKGLYLGTLTDAGLVGLFRAEAHINSSFIVPVGFVYMTDEAVVHRINEVALGDVLATANQVTALQTSLTMQADIPAVLEVATPDATVMFVLFVFTDATGLATDVDGDSVAVALTNNAGDDLSGRITNVTHHGQGRYRLTYSNTPGDAVDVLHWETTTAKSGITRRFVHSTQLITASGGGGGDATLANQTEMLADLDAIQTKLATSNQTFIMNALVTAGGKMTVVPGDSYYTVDGRAALWASGGTWPDLTDATVAFFIYDAPPALLQLVEIPGFVSVATGADQAVGVQIPVSALEDLPPGAVLNYAVRITLANGHPFTPIVGMNKFIVSSGVGLSE